MLNRVGRRNTGTAGLSQELSTETNQTTCGNSELHTDPTGTVVRHVLHAALTCSHQLGDSAQVLLGHVNDHVLHGLVDLAVDGLGNHLGLTHGQFEAFAAHLLHEDSQGELATALNFPRVRTLGGQNLDGHVTDQLAVQAVLHLTCGDLCALDAASQRGGVNTDGHGDRRIVHLDQRQGLGVLSVGEGFTNGDVLDTSHCDDFAGASGLCGNTLKSLGSQQLRDADVLDFAVVTCPCNGLALLQGAVEDTDQCQTTQERGGVQVGHVCLQNLVGVVGGGGHVLDDGLEQRLKVVVVGQLAVCGLVQGCSASLTGCVHHRNVQHSVQVQVGNLVRQVRCQAEQQVHGLANDLVDTGVGAVNLVHHEDHGQLSSQCLTQHEAGLGQRTFGCVHEQHNAVNHGQAALHLATEVGVAGGVNNVNGDGLTVGGRAVVEHGGVLRQNGDALFLFEVAGVHDSVFNICVGREGVGLLQHRVDDGGLAVVNVCHDGHIAKVGARSGVFRHALSFSLKSRG